MAKVRIAPKDYVAGLAVQKLAPLTFRSPKVPQPLYPVDPPAEVRVPTRHGYVRCLVFRPAARAPLAGTPARRPPLHLQIHGGGMIIRNVHEDDHIGRYLASDVGCVVVSIDYHASPQVTYPVAEQECFDVLDWAVRNADQQGWDASRVSVGGGSAGGKFAVNVVQQAYDAGIPLRAAVFSYAVVDMTRSDRTSSLRRPMISPIVQRMVERLYVVDESVRREPLASPILDEDLAAKMPPAVLIQTGDLDTLGPEMVELARRLKSSGVNVQHTAYPWDHAFTVAGKADRIETSVREIGAFLLDALDVLTETTAD
jgi:acetyl esterase